MKILWLATTYPPAPGGGAVYIESISNALMEAKEIEELHIFVEKNKNSGNSGNSGNLFIHKIYPYRAAAHKQIKALNYLKYLHQNLIFFSYTLSYAFRKNIDIIVFHSWYFVNPSLAPLLIKILKLFNVKIVLDARDISIKIEKIEKISSFDKIICCGLRVVHHFSCMPSLQKKLSYIPIPIKKQTFDNSAKKKFLEKHQLTNKKYIFSPNGITDGKDFSLIFKTWIELTNRGYNINLVVAGKKRNWKTTYNLKERPNEFIFVGKLEPRDIHILYSAAALSINISKNEGLPRVPLEALSYDTPLIFPPFTPEFDNAFPVEMIANSIDPSVLASQIIYLLENKISANSYYDKSIHDIKNTKKLTLKLFKEALKN